MGNTFCAVEIRDSIPGKLFSSTSFKGVVELAVAHIKTLKEAEALIDDDIIQELETDLSWSSYTGDVWVYILQSEN